MIAVFVNLTVLKEHADIVEEIAESHSGVEYIHDNQVHEVFGFTEVASGELDFLDELIEKGIPFDNHWEACEDFEEGTIHVRFSPQGELIKKELYTSDYSIPVDTLIHSRENHDNLKSIIDAAAENLLVLPLDSKQIEYGKLYQVARLVIPENELRKTS